MACPDQAWLEGRISALQTRIEAYEDALIALADPTIESYDLDTGQSRQKVTRHEIEQLEANLSSMYNRLATLCARSRGAVVVMRPCF